MSLPKFNADVSLGASGRTYRGVYRYANLAPGGSGLAPHVLPHRSERIGSPPETAGAEDLAGSENGGDAFFAEGPPDDIPTDVEGGDDVGPQGEDEAGRHAVDRPHGDSTEGLEAAEMDALQEPSDDNAADVVVESEDDLS